MTATPKRHRWSRAEVWSQPRTCHDCGMRKDRFGTAGSRYDVFTAGGVIVGDTLGGGRTPPCEPARHVGQRQPGDVRPDRATCRYCRRPIQREVDSTAWTTAKVGVDGRDPQCPAAPNPEDGPMPGHIHDGVIVHPPAPLGES